MQDFYSNNHVKYESNGDRNKIRSVKEYLDEIKPQLEDVINFKKSDTWKKQLGRAISCISFKDTSEECIMYLKSDNIEIMINDKADEIFKNFLNHFFIDIRLGWKHNEKQ